MKWNKEWDNINPKTHHLLNGRILVRMPCIKEEEVIPSGGGKVIISGFDSAFTEDCNNYGHSVAVTNQIKKKQREITKGELVRCSDASFPDNEEKPEIGDMVFFYPYAGNIYLADDEFLYRNMSYKDLTGFESTK